MNRLLRQLVSAVFIAAIASPAAMASPAASSVAGLSAYRPSIDLSGTWQFYIEQSADSMMPVRGSAGLTFTDTVVLPGTTDTNGKGIALSGSLPATVRPVVQVIDNVERNHRLAMVFEVRVGKGRLLVCMADMTRLAQHP